MPCLAPQRAVSHRVNDVVCPIRLFPQLSHSSQSERAQVLTDRDAVEPGERDRGKNRDEYKHDGENGRKLSDAKALYGNRSETKQQRNEHFMLVKLATKAKHVKVARA